MKRAEYFWILFAILFTLCVQAMNNGNLFSCQGQSYANALSNCPDQGVQQMSSGGNVSIFVKNAVNLPNRNNGPSSPMSAPYVKFTYGSHSSRSSVIRNNLNPEWNERVTLGVLGSATEIIVEIWNSDTGLQFSNNLLVRRSIRVPFCSTITANHSEVMCGEPFGCQSDDSSWAMPRRQLCNETGIVSFVDGHHCGSPKAICLFIDILIVPFTLQVELENKASLVSTPLLSVAGSFAGKAPWTTNYGYPFLFDTSDILDLRVAYSKFLRGALMLRMFSKDKAKGRANSIKFWASINFPAYIYICRDMQDNEFGVPEWLDKEYNGENVTITQLLIRDTNFYFGCWYKHADGTVKNRYGGIKSGSLAFKTNTLPGLDNDYNVDQIFYNHNYIILAIPKVIAPREEIITIIYDMAIFINSIGSYGLVFWWFLYFISRFLHKINFRIDRLNTFLVTRQLSGEDKTILASLFLSYNDSPCNIQFRAYLFHALNALHFILVLPFLLLIGWGFSYAATGRPTALGIGIAFMGMSGLSLWFGFNLWESNNWRMSPISLVAIAASVILFLIFIISVIFVDPAVTVYGRHLNFTALSLVFGTINTIPLLLLAFKQDKTYKTNLRVVIRKMADALLSTKQQKAAAAKPGAPKPETKANKVLHALLGNMYTINPNVPLFRFATVLQEPPKEPEPGDDEFELKRGEDLYNFSLAILLFYLFICIARTGYPSLAFLHCLALILFDTLHTSISHGDVNWSPGYKIGLLIAGRLLIMSSGIHSWLLNYSIAYLVYAFSFIQEMITTYLPMLSKRQASEMVFAAKDEAALPCPDIAGTTQFCLGLLTFVFGGILVVSGFGGTNQVLPVPPIAIWGAEWPVFVFGLIAMLITVCSGLLVATIKAFYLQKHGLLRGWARSSYMLRKSVDVPIILAIFTEIAILTTGLLIYSITHCNAFLTVSIFLPIIFMLLGNAYRVWIGNDYELVVWPPKEKNSTGAKDSPSDLEVAFNMIENLFGEETKTGGEVDDTPPESDSPAEKTLKGFKLPPMEPTGNKIDTLIKMPALPLKSVLRRKRQTLGVKVKAPLVKDLKAREGVTDNDKFGGANDAVLDVNDPWGQFEIDEEEEARIKKEKKTKKTGTTFTLSDRQGIMHHPYILKAEDMIKKSKLLQLIIKNVSMCCKFLYSRGKKYARIGMKAKDDEEGGEGEVDPESGEAIEEGDGNNDNQAPKHENLAKMPFWSAVFGGFLNDSEYYALLSWFGGLFMVMMMGIAIAKHNRPEWLGHVIWVSIWMMILTFVPIVKYFNTFTFEKDMSNMAKFVGLFHFLFCVCFFAVALHGDIGIVGSLWILDYFLYFPAFLYMCFELYKWRDENFQIVSLDKDGDGDVSIVEYLQFFKAYPVLLAMMILLTWQFFIWIDPLLGQVAVIVLLVCAFGYIFVRDWAANDFFLSPELTMIGVQLIKVTMFLTFCIGLFSSTNPLFAISVFFFTFIFQQSAAIISRVMIADADTLIFFSPFVLPVYSYDPAANDLVDETHVAKKLVTTLVAGAVWGAIMATFLYPVHLGVAVACAFLLIIAAIVATAMSSLPLQLGRYSSMLDPEAIIDAASSAKAKFSDRKLPVNLEMRDWDGGVPFDYVAPQKSSLDKQKERSSLELAAEVIDETRSLVYIRDDGEYIAKQTEKVTHDDSDDFEPPWYKKLWIEFKAEAKKLFELIPLGKMKGWRKHSEALFTGTDAIVEAIIAGRGPFGFLGLEGYWFKLFQYAQTQPRLAFLQQPWLNAYDENGNSKSTLLLSEHIDSIGIMTRYLELDKALDHVFLEETRCAVHFLLMLLVAADAKMQREQVLFQKFLRENRFRLASNGISPPAEIFSSTSFASINIPLVAVWLSTLTGEERERFQLLKSTFSQEQTERDDLIDNSDYQLNFEADNLKNERKVRDRDMASKVMKEVAKRQADRVQTFTDTLNLLEKQKFMLRKDVWINNPDCFVDSRDEDLYEQFKQQCILDRDEVVEYARFMLAEIEAGQKDCRLGEYGRSYQFVDSEFSPQDGSIGECSASTKVLGWRCAPGICDGVALFSGGTDPDDIVEGVFNDSWLLSALSMLSAAGGIGDGQVDDQIMNLFIGHYAMDGEITFATEVGSYCVRLFKEGIWNPIFLDDLFPMRRKERWNNENRGMACAHSKECNGVWVSLIEKAFAKFYGSYSLLEKGFVHHALEDMTGCEAECLSLSSASRGVGKRTLWDTMVRYRKNGYILGAGTGAATLADKEIQDMGIMFNAAYTIYDIRMVDGQKFLKLRNPPGDHDVWKGDWSDKSDLWTKRLKGKLGHQEAESNAFFMSFDDFCNVFRNLYLCKWYDGKKWSSTQYPGMWKKSDELALEQQNQMKQTMIEQGAAADSKVDAEAEKRKVALARVDTSGGLPTRHNPGCVLENNPHYSLVIHRPTDIRITVTHDEPKIRTGEAPVSYAVFIVQNVSVKTPMRLKSLTKENIVCSTGEPRRDKIQHLYASLKPGLYIVLVPAYMTGMTGNFGITLIANYRNDFQPLWPPKWVLKGAKGKIPGDLGSLVSGEAGSKASGQMDATTKMIRKGIQKLFGKGNDDESSDEEDDAASASVSAAASKPPAV